MLTMMIATKVAVTLLTLVLTCAAFADELPNGIYSVADKDADSGTTVTRADTPGQIRLQTLLTRGFGTPSLVSTSNDNESFRLELANAGPFPENVNSIHQAAYIDGVCVVFGSRTDLDEERKSTVIGYFESLENARKLAKALSIEPQLRQHPGHKVFVKWTPGKTSFTPSEPIELTLTVKNLGDGDLHFVAGGSQRGSRDNQFAFIAHSSSGDGKAVPDTGDPNHFGGPGQFVNLKPGESFNRSVDVAKWFRFRESGRYQLTCMYHIELSSDAADSNSPVWDEFLTGRCYVEINE